MKYCLLLLLALSLNRGAFAQDENTRPERLTCENTVNPMGIDRKAPTLSWNIHVHSGIRNYLQSSYQIIVASSLDKLQKNQGDVWNSGKVNSGENIGITYGGRNLKSFEFCYWKVRIWDNKGAASAWSEPASWTVGFLSEKDWKGSWICSDLTLNTYQKILRSQPDFLAQSGRALWDRGDSIRKHMVNPDKAPAVYFRKEFTITKKIKHAVVYICGLGLNELYINGQRISQDYLNPAYTDYQKTVLYNCYDVTSTINKGNNAIGVILGNGWYNLITPHLLRFDVADYIAPPKLKMQLCISYQDGSSHMIASDKSWQYTTNGPIVFNDILSGETYDARKKMAGWNRVGYPAKAWRKAIGATAPKGELKSQQLFPVQQLDSFAPISIKKNDSGYRIDFGRELCGWMKIKMNGHTRSGQKLKIYYEGLKSHTLGRYQMDEYIEDGTGEIDYAPRFSVKGFRYVDITGLGLNQIITAKNVQAITVNTNLPSMGDFSCSNDTLNKLQQIFINTVRNYIIHIPIDPTREKSGWVQDVENGFDANAYNFDVANMYQKWQYDFNNGIYKNGYVPPVLPGRFSGAFINGPWWGGMIVYNVDKLFQYYADTTIVRESYASMKLYMNYLASISKNYIISWGLGEWLEPGQKNQKRAKTPIPFTSTIAYYFYAKSMGKFAQLLNLPKDVVYYGQLQDSIQVDFNKKFFNDSTGVYSEGSEADQLMPLHFDLVPKNKRAQVIEKLKDAIALRNGHLSTGFVATPLLLTTLSDLGLSDLAYKMTTKTDYPSWIDMTLNKGNQVMKENWQGGMALMPSLAGPISYWYYYSLAGIQGATPAFKDIIIKPDYLSTLSWVSANYQSIRGKIGSQWKRENNHYTIHISIPANTRAKVYLPANNAQAIYEGGQKLQLKKEIQILQYKDDAIILALGSGEYDFEVRK